MWRTGARSLHFLASNLRRALALPRIESADIGGGILVRACCRGDNAAVDTLYCNLNGRSLNRLRSILLRLVGSRLCIVACDKDNRVVGMELFYFNPRDIAENTIHEGYIGVLPAMSGKGIASAMRAHAIVHFRMAGLAGLSSRIRTDNAGSLKSAFKSGFVVSEEVNGEFYMKNV